MIILCDEDDYDVINAKKNLYKVENGQWIENTDISHRKMSNNSIIYKEKPSLERIKDILNSIKINGEPGFINSMEAERRKGTFQGCNPCGEILLKSKQCCNLSTNNLLAFVDDDNKLNIDKLEEILRLSARIAIRMTLVNVELSNWDKVMQEDRIVGISLTGMMDMLNKTNMSYDELAKLLKHLRNVVREEGKRYCEELNENFECVVGITFLPLLTETYPLLPYESITEEEYETRVKGIKPIDYNLLAIFDDDEEHEIIDNECASGVCPIR